MSRRAPGPLDSSLRESAMPMLLLRLLQEGTLTVGRELEVDGRRYRVTGFDPVSVRPRGIYVEELETRSCAVVELVEEP